ncbi:MAG: hypothetical protein R3E87_23590 [Burkholderiaceae bacterium]
MYRIVSRAGLTEGEVREWMIAGFILAGSRADVHDVSVVMCGDGQAAILVDASSWGADDLMSFGERCVELQRRRFAGEFEALSGVDLAPLLESIGDGFKRLDAGSGASPGKPGAH